MRHADAESTRWRWTRESAGTALVLCAATAIAGLGARPYAGGWNDGSRLAAVESLVDYGTLNIDRSIFVVVPPRLHPSDPTPYPPDNQLLMQYGTRDRLLVRGHSYSDKPPVPTLLMALLYKGLQLGTGLRARERPDRFCYLMTLGTSGVAYVLTMWCMLRLGTQLGLTLARRMALAASLGLATVALTYTRHVNAHIILLAVAAALLVLLVRLADDARAGRIGVGRPLAVGALAGLAYTVDLGAGPVIAPAALAVVAARTRRVAPVTLALLAALPWTATHHAVNYAIGGTVLPASLVPEYLQAAGGVFTSHTMTGAWNHDTVGHFVVYAAAVLFGKRGFIGHNLPLFLVIPAAVSLVRRESRYRAEVWCALAWMAGVWLVYAAGSTNYSGVAASIRWFVPLLAPAYFLIARYTEGHRRQEGGFLILTAFGILMAVLMWWRGPWMDRMVPFYWPTQAAALLTWFAHHLCTARTRQQKALGTEST